MMRAISQLGQYLHSRQSWKKGVLTPGRSYCTAAGGCCTAGAGVAHPAGTLQRWDVGHTPGGGRAKVSGGFIPGRGRSTAEQAVAHGAELPHPRDGRAAAGAGSVRGRCRSLPASLLPRCSSPRPAGAMAGAGDAGVAGDVLSGDSERRCRARLAAGGAAAAAVLVPLCSVRGRPALLFTLRSRRLAGPHSGDVRYRRGERAPGPGRP